MLILDALGAIGMGKAMEAIALLLFLGALPGGVIIYLLVQLANQHLDEQLDHEWTAQKAAAAATKRHHTWFVLVLCCVFLVVIWWGLLAG